MELLSRLEVAQELWIPSSNVTKEYLEKNYFVFRVPRTKLVVEKTPEGKRLVKWFHRVYMKRPLYYSKEKAMKQFISENLN